MKNFTSSIDNNTGSLRDLCFLDCQSDPQLWEPEAQQSKTRASYKRTKNKEKGSDIGNSCESYARYFSF